MSLVFAQAETILTELTNESLDFFYMFGEWHPEVDR